MGAFSDYWENKIVDATFRGQPLPQLGALYVGLGTGLDASPETNTPLVGEPAMAAGDYQRAVIPCSLNTWRGTSGNPSATPSNGDDGITSNNIAIQFGVAASAWGSMTHFALFDAPTGGNAIVYGALTAPVNVTAGTQVSFAVGTLVVNVGAGAFGDYWENKIIDSTFRGVAWTSPPTLYIALLKSAPTDQLFSPGAEIGMDDNNVPDPDVAHYRAAVASNLVNWASTQENGVPSYTSEATQANLGLSTGNSGKTANRYPIVFPDQTDTNRQFISGALPATHFAILDDQNSTSRIVVHGALTAAVTINPGDPPAGFPQGGIVVTVDT